MNTTTGSKYFHNWLKGDFRTDGFESDWKREQLRRRAEDAEAQRFIRAEQIAERQRRAAA